MADGGVVVAVIDDDDAVRDSLGALLEAEGYDVDTYASGPAFLEALPDALPACALVDVRMPEMDGLELQRRLADAAPALPVIIITGHGDIAMAVRAIKAGAVDFVEKPFPDRAILDGIAQALASREEALNRETRRLDIHRRLDRLTAREREVFERLARGSSNKAVARDLGNQSAHYRGAPRADHGETAGAQSRASRAHGGDRAGEHGRYLTVPLRR